MPTNHKPATPLPWRVSSMGYLCNGNMALASTDASGGHVLSMAVADAEYTAHTANAYPKLVEALRTVIDSADSSISPEAFRREKLARALLRELGEE